jgi:hypothetical protein
MSYVRIEETYIVCDNCEAKKEVNDEKAGLLWSIYPDPVTGHMRHSCPECDELEPA